jgi:signal transduction histidine kinase
LLARSLDILAAGTDAETRLAGLLDLLASTVGARRAAVIAGGHERRVAVTARGAADAEDAEALGAWLDAWAPRSRASRAAAGRAPIALVGLPADEPGPRAVPAKISHHYACLPIPAAGDVVLGFDFATDAAAAALDARLPPALARHAAVALALVTEQFATERDMADLHRREAERSRFVSTVAHELRTPLTGLKGYLELILGDQVADPADERDFLERSRQIVETMGELVGDLLELSRLESDTLRLEIAPFSVAEVGQRVVAQLAPIAHGREVRLETNLPPRLRAATGDRRRVEQILTNLGANALKFAPPRSAIDLAGWFEGQVALFAVRDEGAGIGPDDRGRIFERFFRMAGHERVTGTGLGLPIARDLARAMGGDLDVASVPGAGSTFILAMPGPAGADEELVERTLGAAVANEEQRLEERAVLRAIDAHGLRHRPPPSAEARPTPAGRRPALRAIAGTARIASDRNSA